MLPVSISVFTVERFFKVMFAVMRVCVYVCDAIEKCFKINFEMKWREKRLNEWWTDVSSTSISQNSQHISIVHSCIRSDWFNSRRGRQSPMPDGEGKRGDFWSYLCKNVFQFMRRMSITCELVSVIYSPTSTYSVFTLGARVHKSPWIYRA